MDHDPLDRLRQLHPAWRILVADHAPLVLSFLTLAFIQPDRRAIPAPEIAGDLSFPQVPPLTGAQARSVAPRINASRRELPTAGRE